MRNSETKRQGSGGNAPFAPSLDNVAVNLVHCTPASEQWFKNSSEPVVLFGAQFAKHSSVAS